MFEKIKKAICSLLFGDVEKNTVYKYKYQRHPFDDWQFFSVEEAVNQEEANVKAVDRFTHLFENKQTVMTVFYLVT